MILLSHCKPFTGILLPPTTSWCALFLQTEDPGFCLNSSFTNVFMEAVVWTTFIWTLQSQLSSGACQRPQKYQNKRRQYWTAYILFASNVMQAMIKRNVNSYIVDPKKTLHNQWFHAGGCHSSKRWWYKLDPSKPPKKLYKYLYKMTRCTTR